MTQSDKSYPPAAEVTDDDDVACVVDRNATEPAAAAAAGGLTVLDTGVNGLPVIGCRCPTAPGTSGRGIGNLCPGLVTTLGDVVLIPGDTVVTVLGAVALVVGVLCPGVALGALVLMPRDGVVLVMVLGVLP